MSEPAPALPPEPPAAAMLEALPLGLLLLDSEQRIEPPASPEAARLLQCEIPFGRRLADVLKPLASEKTLARVEAALARRRETPSAGELAPLVLDEVELRLGDAGGAARTAHYRIELRALPAPGARTLVLISDVTVGAQQARELQDLRLQNQAQGEILRGVLRLGRARFAASVQKTDAAMARIDHILNKPAREQAAFRKKLEETLDQVDRIRREGAALRLTSLEQAARSFEDALHELRGRTTLSGSDFLPLALKLDELYGRFATLRAVTKSALPAPRAADAAPATDNGTQIIDAPQFIRRMRAAAAQAGAPRAAPPPAGSLEKTLVTLTEHIAEEHHKSARLECRGLEAVPAAYRSTVKNAAIQLIRNAIMHGIEPAARRARLGKPPVARLALSFQSVPAGGYEVRFEDDGRGIDPELVRRAAADHGLLAPEQAAALSDRQAIKLIFKSGFTTLPQEPNGTAHGAGLTLVRRYVDEAGGAIALASEIGKRTRYKISLPERGAPAP